MGRAEGVPRRRKGRSILAYLDSSAAIRRILQGDLAYFQVQACDRILSSELLQIECRRVLWRERLGGRLGDREYLLAETRWSTLVDEVELFALDSSIKQRAAEAFPIHMKTLDALHIATALAIREAHPEQITAIFSYDENMNRAARILGLAAPWSGVA